MKNELKISTVSIICVLCASAVSGAYGASSVRSLGGAGTYTSAASASQSGASTGVARAGSVRVTPTSGKTTAVKPSNAPSTTSGRVSTPRLSLGKYLGGNTAISGGASTRPNPGGSVGGGGTSTVDPGLAAELNNRVNVLEDTVSDLKASSEDLSETKQDKLIAGNYIIVENDGEVYLDVKALGADTTAEIVGDDLMLTIGQNGTPVTLISLTELLTSADMDGAIEEALATKGFATQTELKGVADDVADAKTAIAKNATDIAANATAIENIKAVSGDVAALTNTLSAKADKQTTATKDTIAVIGDGGQYVGSDKKLSDLVTSADIDSVTETVTNTVSTGFETKMTELKTTVENNMQKLTQELAGVNTTINNITNEDGSLYIAPNSITSVELKDGSVTNTKLAQKAVKLENLDTDVESQLVGAPTSETDGMYVLLVTPTGERIWADLATEDTPASSPETGGATN